MAKKGLMKDPHRGEKGFTLIEMVITIALLGIVAMLVILNLQTFITMGKVAAAKGERSIIQTAVDGMMADAKIITMNEVSGWNGSAGVVTVDVDGDGNTDYDAADCVRRTPTKGTYDVAATGTVTCASYEDLAPGDLDNVNA